MRKLLLALLATTLLGAAAPDALATVTCSRSGATLTVNLSGFDDASLSVDSSSNIQVADDVTGPVACTGTAGTPSTGNTDRINVDNPGSFVAFLTINDPAAFAPGMSAEFFDPTPEIEIDVNLNDSSDVVTVKGTPNRDVFRFGSDGLNPNVAAESPLPPPDGNHDADVFINNVETLTVTGGGGDDELSMRGGFGTGNVRSGEIANLEGDAGDDMIDHTEGGFGILSGGDGDDTILARGGNDLLHGDTGDDSLDGGDGTDDLGHEFVPNPVSVDLAISGPQDTRGAGRDTLADIENVGGTQQADVLRGDDGTNVISGRDGNDLVEGRGDGDSLRGDDGVDTLSYASAPGSVSADLDVVGAQDTGSAGNDALESFENLTGTPFADVLAGDEVANLIDPLDGSDSVNARDGNDRLELRDQTGDSAICGPGADTAIADLRGIDTLAADCELVDFVQFPADLNAPDLNAPAFLGRVRATPGRFWPRRTSRTDLVAPTALRRSTTFRYRLSEPAQVTFRFSKRARGRRVRGRCRKPTARNRSRRRCTRYVAAGSLVGNAVTGANATRFNGVVRRKVLSAGVYRAQLTAEDAAGNRSKTARASFRVVKPRRSPRR
jgi:Ca2+-binding RTX toxin-like protein